MLSLDEAIKQCEEIADNFERTLARFDGDNVQKENTCACMNDHRQLASWLKELKDLREQQRLIKFNVYALNELVNGKVVPDVRDGWRYEEKTE